MKNYLLFNQSFGTEGSPNQTGETLTRENRIGLMSYLRRTLMLLFAVLVMSIANIGMAWGATVTMNSSIGTSATPLTTSPYIYNNTSVGAVIYCSNAVNANWTKTGSPGSASGEYKPILYNSVNGTSLTTAKGLYSASGSNPNTYKPQSTKYYTITFTNCTQVKVSGTGGGTASDKQLAFVIKEGSTVIDSTVVTSKKDLNNPESATSSTLSPSKTYTLKVCGTGANDCYILEVAFYYPAASPWTIRSNYTDNNWSTNRVTMTGTTTVTGTWNITTAGLYQFKVVDTSSDKWYGNGGNIGCNVSGWTFDTSSGDCKFFASETGNYTFTFNTSTKALSVTYPTAQGKYYYKNTGSWGAVYVYRFKGGINNGWPGTQVVETETICGDTYYFTYADPGTTLIFDNNNDKQTGDMTASGNAGKYVAGTGSSWTTFPTYTISYAANSGSGSMSSQTGIACGTDKATTANAFTRDGYNFTGWKANVDVKVGGSTKTAGTLLADGVTIQDISSNITLTAQWEEVVTLYTVTYNVNGGGSVTPTSATQASSGASVTLPTPTWSGYTFEGWYNAGTKIGVGGASYTPTADITLYAHWTDNISGKVFSFIDNNYGDKFKSFTGYGWVAKDSTGRSKTFTNASTGVEYRISAAGWDIKNNAISALAKFLGGTSSMSIVIPTGKIATVKISYNAYGTGDDFRLTVNSTAQANPSTKLANDMTNAQVIASMKEITLSSQTGTLTLGISNTGKNNYIGRVSAVITGYTVSYAAGTYGSGSLASGTKTAGSSFTLSSSSSAFTRSGYVYDGWSVNADGSTKDYNLGGSYTTDAAITLYPHWVADCVAPATVNVTATVNEVSGFWFYPDDDIVLTAAPTGSPAGSPVTYQWKKNGADIDGATSNTYTIDEAAASDAGKYTCTISYGACSTTSAEFELKCMQFYLKNSGGSDISNHALTKVDATHATLSLSLTGGTTYKFRVTDGCNNWYGNSDETGMTSSNCTNWTMPHDADCKVTTSSKSATYTFNFDFSAGLLGSEMKVSVVYPAGDQAEGKVIYWDNNVLNWASAPWYRIGKGTHNNKTQMTLVPGTANLYKVTTTEYNGFEYWHIANNEGEGTGNIFWTKDSDPTTNEEITNAMGFEGSPVTADAVTFTPTSSHATGTSSVNDNCEFYEYGQQNGMKTDRVTISDYSNGTITVNYVDTDEEAATLTTGYADLAHSVILTSITAVADEGYDASAITINGGDYSANYVVTGNTTIAASFTLKTYTISYNKGTNGTGSKANETKTHGVNFTLPGSTFTYGGHTQDGWSTSDGGALAYALSGSYTTNAAQEFFPHWKCNTPEISCSSNTITISVPTGATVYYTTTTDGSDPADPTSSSTAYNPSSKPTISADTKIKAIAIQSGCTNSAIASASLTYVAAGPSYTAPTSALDISAQTSVTAAALITANNATQSYYLSTNTDTLLLIPSDIYYNIGNGKKNTWATANGSPSNTSADWGRPNGSVSFKGRTWWKSGGNINTLQVRSDRTLNIRVKGCKTVSVLNAAANSTKYFVMEAYEYDDGYTSSDPAVSASNTSTSVTETSLSLNSSKEYVVVLRGNTEDNNKVYEIKFIAPSSGYTVSIAANPAGYGTVSSSSVTSVASGTSLSTSTNTLSVGATNVTATATSASAEYTYSFNNWTKSDGTALPLTVTADLSVYANFTRTANNYTLAWSSNGGSELSGDYTSGSTAYGASITAPNDPTLSNYTFDGWKTNNDGTGTTAGATMPAANMTYYAAWKQTVTLKTGAQGSGADQTPYVYINGTALNGFSAHTATGYTLQGYYTAGSGGVKVLNADGTFAAANVTDYITSSKWSRTGAAPTLFAQWVATEDCHTLKYAWKITGKFCDDGSTSVTASDTVRFPANASNLYFTVSGTGNTVSKGSSYNLGNTQNNYFLLTAKTGYQIKSICFYGKVQDSSVDYTTDGSSWSSLTSTNTSGDDYYSFSSINASAFGIKLTAATPEGVWIRNMVIEVCAEGGTTYNVEYDGNDETSGTAPTDATDYNYSGTVTVLGNTGSLEKTSYTFAGWTTNDDGTGSSYEAGSTFSITDNTTLYAKWTQAVTLDKNGGSTNGSATAVWNATGLTGITHAKPAAGYKLLGYYSASSEGTKVLNSDGSFAATNVTGYITSGKWSRTSATTLYAEYESAGALTWNLIVNSDTANLSTSTKTSAFTEISTTNMTNATLAGDLTYEKSKKSALTGKISTPAHDADKYVKVTFQVASGYKFIPSLISVPIQPVGDGEHKAVELSLTDTESHSLVSGSATKCDGTVKGKTTTVTLAGDGSKFFEGTVTLKIYVYPHASATASSNNCYRLGTPITIEGEIEEACGTMPSYTSMSYTTTTFAPGDDASGSPITIVGGENIDTYQWKYNTVNDRTSGTNCGTNNASLTPLTDASATIDGTRYYWCEMTNDACGITIKSPAVAITVAAAKSDATVTWTDPATPNYGGGGYTIKATVNEIEWNGNAADLVITAPAGIRIYNVSSGTTSSQKWVQADFDVQTSFDRTTYASNIPFSVSAAATATYNAISDEHNVSYSACAGGGDATEYLMPVNADSVNSTVKGWRFAGTGKMWFGHGSSTPGTGSSNIKSLDNTMAGGVINKYYNNSGSYFSFYTEKAITGVRLYVYTSNSNVEVSNVYIANSQFSTGTPSSGAVTYEVVYNDDNEGLDKGDNVYSAWAEITFASEVAAGKYGLIKLDNNVRIAGIGLLSGSSSGATLTTALTWSETVDDDSNKKSVLETAANFRITASQTGENSNSLGAITYSSNHPEYASVNATSGWVTITGAGTAQITATLSASGCYRGATKTYTIVVEEVTCDIAAGTLSADKTSKCEAENATLTLTGFESGATVTWYNGDDEVTSGISTEGTTSTLTTSVVGTYSVMVNKGCDVRSNSVTISNKSTSVHVTRLVKEWYIKNGRLTPDIALWELGDDCSFVSVTASDGWDAGTGLAAASSFYAKDGIVYLKGTEPKANNGTVQNYTLTLIVNDGCGNQTLGAEGKIITIHHQQNTDKHVLAFVVSGEDKGDWTAGVTADQTTSVGLYNAIAANFDVLATNSRSTDDEQKLKEYYSQFDILCITDYPNTGDKGANKKSYVDALGALVDIRPILTMEAWVSKLANWKAKGISGNPKSPSTRQYKMDLQCKDHEIFARTELTKIGEGDEAMYRVSMVDNTKEDYATLDATYGGGAHAEKDGYNYGGKPALQGFTFTEDMADDLLPIGLIDDGAGNPLQVGIERQENMEARLMVLGINSYAMERLTDDGEQVVINALNYLMKKNQEDIADCSTAFVGGAVGHEKEWDNADNWTGNTVPLPSQKVRILADCEVSSTVYAQSVLIVTDGKYNHGSDNAAGKLTIKENGALIVGGKIQAASAPAYNRPRATTPDRLLIETSSTNQAALIFDNEEAETQATVNLYSLGSKPSSYQYQYFAVPMEVVPVNPVFANETHGGTGIYTYVYEEASSGWTRRKYYDDLFAFEGLGITTKSTGAMNYTMTGNLASTATKEITLTHDGAGLNLVGNSWMAPIQIGALAEDNTDANITQTAYIYCAGRDAEGGAVVSSDDTETAGQWLAVPFEAAEFATWKEAGKLSVIPAMQAFQIKVDAEATLTLDYDKVVRGSTNDLNAKLRAPGRRMAANEVTMTNIRVADSKTHTDLSLFEGDRFSEAFDNGWEAEYMNGDGRSAKLYAETEAGQMAVAAMYDYEGTVVGFAPGQETEYTFSFMGEDNGYYLNDIKLQNSVRISEGETYTFTYEEGDAANRFYISRTAINAPAVATGMENLDAAAPRVQKIIYNDKLYIIRGGRLYDATGKVVK